MNKIDELASKRKTWEEGTYKASTVELCLLLEECYAIFEEARANKTLAKRIRTLVEERKLTVQENTSLATRIVRLVFGNPVPALVWAGILGILGVGSALLLPLFPFVLPWLAYAGRELVRQVVVAGDEKIY